MVAGDEAMRCSKLDARGAPCGKDRHNSGTKNHETAMIAG